MGKTFIRNFDYNEFDCYLQEGSGYRHMDREFLLMIDEMQEKTTLQIRVMRGYVSPQMAERVGLPKDHPHLLGRAACIWCKDPKKRIVLVAALLEVGFHRIGIGPDYLYFDNDEARPAQLYVLSRDKSLIRYLNKAYIEKYRK